MARIPYLSYTLFVLNARAKPKSSSPGVCVPECEKGESCEGALPRNLTSCQTDARIDAERACEGERTDLLGWVKLVKMGQRQSRERPPLDGAPSTYPSHGDTAQQVNDQRSRPLPANSNYAWYPSAPHWAQQQQQQAQQAQQQQAQQQLQQRSNQAHHRQQQEQEPKPAKSLTQTATIRNAVNLKKSTLRLVPSEAKPGFLQVAFEFDASQPCLAMTFVAVRERLDGSMKSALAHVAGVYREGVAPRPFQPGVKYSTGMSQKFPGTKDGTSRHGIDLLLFREDDFARLGTGTHDNEFPLVVRLATVTDKGRRDGHTLDDIVPGEPLPKWVQGQTTFASVSRDPASGTHGEWKVKVVKQKLWVEGVSYVLQEIYGLEKTNSGRTDGGECVICFDRAKNTTVLPCTSSFSSVSSRQPLSIFRMDSISQYRPDSFDRSSCGSRSSLALVLQVATSVFVRYCLAFAEHVLCLPALLVSPYLLPASLFLTPVFRFVGVCRSTIAAARARTRLSNMQKSCAESTQAEAQYIRCKQIISVDSTLTAIVDVSFVLRLARLCYAPYSSVSRIRPYVFRMS